jgi:rhomboid family GlyGly-CTERM serine protease
VSRSASLPWATAALSLLALATLASPGLTGVLAFRRGELADGQVWRLLTGHWTHWSVDHLAWDLLVFALAGGLLESRGRGRFLACTAISAFAVGAGVWSFEPAIGEYRGLSGIAAALFTAAAIDALSRSPRAGGISAVPLAALAGFFAKLVFEVATGQLLFVDAGAGAFVPLPLCHLIGGIAGIAVAAPAARARWRIAEGFAAEVASRPARAARWDPRPGSRPRSAALAAAALRTP